jgi:hypothetical protein
MKASPGTFILKLLRITILAMALLVWACTPVKEVAKTSATLTKNIEDTTEYNILIIDPDFDQWYLFN